MPPVLYYPSLVCNIRMIFDEALTLVQYPDPVTTEALLANPPSGFSSRGLEPLLVRPGAENASFIYGRVPKSASISLPGYRKAGEFSCTLDFNTLPIDPRTVRAAAIEVHLGTVSASDFAAGMRGPNPDGTRSSILKTRDETGAINRKTLKMLVSVDEWDMRHTEKGSEVTLTGRDPRGILLDTPINVLPKATKKLLDSLDLSQPIDNVVSQILAFNPFFQDFVVIVNPSEWPPGPEGVGQVPRVLDDSVVPRHRRGAKGKIKGGRGNPPSDSMQVSFWDLIVRFCYLVGAVPYFQGNGLYIRPVRALYDQQRAGDDVLNPTPFLGGKPRALDKESQTTIDPALRIRRIVYGRDTNTLSFDRKFAGFQRPRVIRAICMDQSSTALGPQRTLVGWWPPVADKKRRTKVGAGGAEAQEEVVNIPVAGIRDVNRLTQIAQSIYEEMGRGEIGGTCETKKMASFGGDNTDPDLLNLNPGDAVEFLVDVRNLGQRAPNVSPYTDSLRKPFERQVQEVAALLGGDLNLARVIVGTARGQIQELQRVFRVQNVKYTWGDKSISVGFDFQNYVEVRDAIGYSTPEFGDLSQQPVPSRSRTRISRGVRTGGTDA